MGQMVDSVKEMAMIFIVRRRRYYCVRSREYYHRNSDPIVGPQCKIEMSVEEVCRTSAAGEGIIKIVVCKIESYELTTSCDLLCVR